MRFDIRGQMYEYHMSKKDAETVNWLKKKSVGKALNLAKKLRTERKKMESEKGYVPNCVALIEEVTTMAENKTVVAKSLLDRLRGVKTNLKDSRVRRKINHWLTDKVFDDMVKVLDKWDLKGEHPLQSGRYKLDTAMHKLYVEEPNQKKRIDPFRPDEISNAHKRFLKEMGVWKYVEQAIDKANDFMMERSMAMREARQLVKLTKEVLGKEKLTDEQLEERLDSLRIRNRGTDGPFSNGPWVSKSFRNQEFFTHRYEDDDDWPEFTGYDKVMSIVKKHFADWLRARLVEVDIEEDEKGWFTVSVRAK